MSDGTCRRRSNSPNSADVVSGFAELPPLVGAKVGVEGFGCVGISLVSRLACDIRMQMADDDMRTVGETPCASADVPPDVVVIPVSHTRITEPAQLSHDRRGNDAGLGHVVAALVVRVGIPAVLRQRGEELL